MIRNIRNENQKVRFAHLFFFKDYRGAQKNLPGVEYDENVLVELLSKYKQEIFHENNSVLEELRAIVDDYKERKFERVHFHFSGKKFENYIEMNFCCHLNN